MAPSFFGVRVTVAPSACAIEAFDAPMDDEVIVCDWPFECQLRTFPLNILLDVERRLAAFPLHVPSQEKSAAKALEADITAIWSATYDEYRGYAGERWLPEFRGHPRPASAGWAYRNCVARWL